MSHNKFSAEDLQPFVEEYNALAAQGLAVHGCGVHLANKLGLSNDSVRRRMAAAREMGLLEHNRYAPKTQVRYSNIVLKEEQKRLEMSVSPPSAISGTVRVLAIGDIHCDPTLPMDRMKWLGRLANEVKATHIVSIGDVADLHSLCSHEDNDTLRGRLKPAFLNDIDNLNDCLSLFNGQLDQEYKPVKHITLGNHEGGRISSFEDRTPEISGMMKEKFYGTLDRHGWSYTEYGAYHNIGGVLFTHVPFNKMGKPFASITQIAHHQTCDLVYGHTHVPQVWRQPKSTGHITVINLGCYLPWGHIENYAKHSMTGWGYCAWVLKISEGHITDYNMISVKSLEERYG